MQDLPERIDRYDIVRLIGRGGEGTVLLATDRELGRPVALKLLSQIEDPCDGTLVHEARIVSRLQHPNVVTLHDIGSYHGRPYLVFEYIEGESLAERIARDGALGVRDAVILGSQILAGIAYLHENGVVHRDLKPANILISSGGVPKVTDFGVSAGGALDEESIEVAGTLRYLAPETLRGQSPGPPSDVFSLGSVLVEMLTGTPLFDGDSVATIANEITFGPPVDGTTLAPDLDLDPQFASVLRTASQRNPAERFSNAREMKAALDAYRLPRNAGGDSDELPGTFDYLLRRIARRPGFSSLSHHIGEILKLTSDESVAPARTLVNVLAKDLTLTQRLLSRANSAANGRATVTDLGGAVRMLGLEQVRMCVTRVLLEKEFEQGSSELREVLLCSFHSALVAKSIAPACGVRNASDAFTAAMFHELGRTLTIHYLKDDHDEIVARTRDLHGNEITESRIVLGVPYHELGMAVAHEWALSDAIVRSMAPLPRGAQNAPDSALERLHVCAALANAFTRAQADACDAADADAVIGALLERSQAATTLTPERLGEVLAETGPLMPPYARLIRVDPAGSEVCQRLARSPALAA